MWISCPCPRRRRERRRSRIQAREQNGQCQERSTARCDARAKGRYDFCYRLPTLAAQTRHGPSVTPVILDDCTVIVLSQIRASNTGNGCSLCSPTQPSPSMSRNRADRDDTGYMSLDIILIRIPGYQHPMARTALHLATEQVDTSITTLDTHREIHTGAFS